MRKILIAISAVLLLVFTISGCTSKTVLKSQDKSSAAASGKADAPAPAPTNAGISANTTKPGVDTIAVTTGSALNTSPPAVKTQPQYDASLNGKYVCLTFDDGPSDLNTPKVLKALKKYDAKATFFICGPDTPERRKLVKQTYDDGHAIGIHCYSHYLKTLYKSEQSFFADFDKMEKMILDITGCQPTLFRFPGGTNNGYIKNEVSDKIIAKLKERGYEYYDWNVSSLDDNAPPARQIYNRVISQCKSRAKKSTPSIALIHDSSSRYTSGDAVPVILAELTKKGFKFISISDKVTPVHFVKY